MKENIKKVFSLFLIFISNFFKRKIKEGIGIMMNKKFGKNGKEKLKLWEALYLYPYDDADKSKKKKRLKKWNKRATIGYGYLIPKELWDSFKDGIDEQAAERLLLKALKPKVEVVNEVVIARQTQNQFDALVIFCYNIGETGFKTSTALKMINDSTYKSNVYPTLEKAWKAFNKVRDPKTKKKIVSKGLINRRNKEWNFYSNIEE